MPPFLGRGPCRVGVGRWLLRQRPSSAYLRRFLWSQVGFFLHYVSDAQKFFVLQLRNGLIKDGLFARTRNPNYLGEVLIYGGFALASWHWQPALVLAGWFLYFVRNMRGKDRSMSRHPEFAAYKDRTGMLLPSLGIRGAALARHINDGRRRNRHCSQFRDKSRANRKLP